MKKIVLVFSLISISLMCSGISLAKEMTSVGAGQTGTTISLGYDGSYLSYKEIMNGNVLDKDTGWLNGGFFELRSDNEISFTRITFDASWSNSATYNGALQNGTPLTMTTKEKVYQGEVNVGYKALNFGTATLSPYVALGYRDWIRGQDNLPDYQEKYTWWYGALGANLAYRHKKWLLGLDAAVEFPFSLAMNTNTAGLTDNATFSIKSRPGFRVEVPMSYSVYRDEDINMFIFGTPYYQRWNIGASDPVALTKNGMPLTQNGVPIVAVEPQSHTDIYGLRLGIGVNF